MTTHPHLWLEPLEHRRLLSSEGLDEMVNNDAELFGAIPGREPIYPPLAPAMWMEESIGSFELPEGVTAAFFAPDEPSAQVPADDVEQDNVDAPPPVSAHAVDANDAGSQSTRTTRIAGIIFPDEQPLPDAGVDPFAAVQS